MRCPVCGTEDSRVVDSRTSADAIRRRRECQSCGYRFTTFERIETRQLVVQKRDGTREAFDRDKVRRGVVLAMRKRPFTPEQREEIVSRVVSRLDDRRESTIPSSVVGEAVMDVLRETDEVAYVRFASVYRAFESVEQFVDAVRPLQDLQDRPGRDTP